MGNFVGNNIFAIRTHWGLSQEKFAEMAGVSQTTVSAWECGTSTPRKSNVNKIIEAIPGLKFDDVMSEGDGFASAPPKQERVSMSWVEVPLYGSIAAGRPIEMEEADGSFVVPSAMHARFPDAFLLKVVGESMNRVLPNGSYALVDPTREVLDGRAYAVCVNGYDATVKRVRRLNNGFELVPDSTDPTFKPMVYDYGDSDTDTVTVIGRVVWYVVPFDFDI